MRAVVVAHPGGQHAGRLAEALEKGHMLQRFYTGLDPGGLVWRMVRGRGHLGYVNLPWGVTRSMPMFDIVSAFLRRTPTFPARSEFVNSLGVLWTRKASSYLQTDLPKIVVCFENNAVEIFREAKRLQVLCVLDTASVHHSAQTPPVGWDTDLVESVRERKDEEIALADKIVTLSRVAFDSYRAGGVPVEKLRIVPVGVDTERFHPGGKPSRGRLFTILYVGSITRHKGVDVLLEAYQSFANLEKRLVVVGRPIDRTLTARLKETPGVKVSGTVDHASLDEIYRSADVVVVPSRFDGFGLVAAEAMACGTPAIVSSNTGVSEFIRDGENGWIFRSDDVGHLVEALQKAEVQSRLSNQRSIDARRTAQALSWDAYGKRIRELYGVLLQGQL